MTGRLFTLLVVSPLFLGVSFAILNIFLNMVDPLYTQFTLFKANGYDWTAFLNLHFETAYVYTINMDYWLIYVVVGSYLVWQGFLSPFYDITKTILSHRMRDIGKHGVPVDIEATADKEPVEDVVIEQRARSNEPTQIQIIPVPMLTQEQLNAINKLTENKEHDEKSATVDKKSSEENPTVEAAPSKPVAKPTSKFPTSKTPKEKFPTPPAKPIAFKPNRNLDTPEGEQNLGKVYMNVPSEIKALGKKDGE